MFIAISIEFQKPTLFNYKNIYHHMETNEKPPTIVIWLSVLHVIYLLSLPILANITIAPIVRDQTFHAVFWFIFGILGMPISYAGMMSLNPFPRDLIGALMRTLFLPITAGLWWWYLDGSLIEFFAVMLIYEFLAIFLSIFMMSFIPLKLYDSNNPKAGNARAYINILLFQGFIAAGGFMIVLVIAIWPWAINDPLWYRPFTYILLFTTAIQYIISNFRWHRSNAYRWEEDQKRPKFVGGETVSIEPVLLLVSIPWLISFAIINK